MKFYKVHYTLSQNGEHLYPASTKGVVWKNAHYHHSDNVMIAETEIEIEAGGKQVVALTKKEALALIKEFHESHPAPPKKGLLPPLPN